MYKFIPFLLTDRNSRAYPVVSIGFSFITCDNNNLYAYDIKFPGIWSYNLSTNLWVELISLKKYLLSFPEDKIVGITKENNLIKIFTIRVSADGAKTRLHICNLDTKEIVEKILSGILPDSECFCRMNIFYYNNYYYSLVCAQTLDFYRLNLDTHTWEYVNKSSPLGPSYPAVQSTLGIVYNDNKIYLFNSLSLNCIWVFNLETNCWDASYMSNDTTRESYKGKTFPDGKDSYSMSKFVDPDSNDAFLLVSNGENLRTYNADSEIWTFNLTSLEWKCLGEFGDLKHRCFFRRWACITPKGKLVTCDESSDDRKSRHVFSRKVYSTWTRVPALVDICWDAVLHYYPNLPNKSKDDVEQKFGIPWKFLQMRVK